MHQNEDNSEQEAIDKLLVEIRHGATPYIEIDTLEDVFDYLVSVERIKDADLLTTYATSLYPESSRVMLMRASVLTDMDKLSDAKALLDYVAPLEKDNPYLYVNYGWRALKLDDMDEVVKNFDKAMELMTQSAESDDDLLFEIGLNLNAFEKFEYTVRYLEPYVERNPNMDQALFELAFAYDKVDRIDDSIRTYEHLVDVSPFYETSWYNLGVLYSKRDEVDKSIMAYDTAIAINPQYPEPYFNIGNSYMSADRFEDAANSYSEYISLARYADYFEPIVYMYLGECMVSTDNFDMGIRFFDMALKFLPNNTHIWYLSALAFIDTNNPSEALKRLTKAVRLNPENADYYYAKAQAYYNMMNKDKAMEMLEKGLSINPDEPMAWFELYKLRIASEFVIFDPLAFLKQARQKYGDRASLKLVEAHVHYAILRDTDAAVDIICEMLDQTPDVIYEAALDPLVRQMLDDKVLNRKLNNRGKTL